MSAVRRGVAAPLVVITTISTAVGIVGYERPKPAEAYAGGSPGISVVDEAFLETDQKSARFDGTSIPENVTVLPGEITLVEERIPLSVDASPGDQLNIPARYATTPSLSVASSLPVEVLGSGAITRPELTITLPPNYEPGMEMVLGGAWVPVPPREYVFDSPGAHVMPSSPYIVDMSAGLPGLAPIECSRSGVCPVASLFNFVAPLGDIPLADQMVLDFPDEVLGIPLNDVPVTSPDQSSGVTITTPSVLVETPPSTPEVRTGGGGVLLPSQPIIVPVTASPGDTVIVPAATEVIPSFPVSGPILATEPLAVGGSVPARTLVIGVSGTDVGELLIPESSIPLNYTVAEMHQEQSDLIIAVDSLEVTFPSVESSEPWADPPQEAPMLQQMPHVQPAPIAPDEYPLQGSPTTECDDGATADEFQLCIVVPSDAASTAITGRLSMDDEDLTPLQGAEVRISVASYELTAVTDPLGQFAFTNIPVGVANGTVAATIAVRVGSLAVQPLQLPSLLTVSGYLLRGGEGHGVHILLEGGEAAQAETIPAATDGNNQGTAPRASGDVQYPREQIIPAVVAVDMYEKNSRCASTGRLLKAAKRFPWKFYVLHVIGPEIRSEFGFIDSRAEQISYLVANGLAISNYAWKHRTQGSKLNNTTQFQCFEPKADVSTWWRSNIGSAFRRREQHGDGKLALTQYKGAGVGQHDQSCSPPFRYDDVYQLSQIEARFCADAGLPWDWIVNSYYNPNSWSLGYVSAPDTPGFGTASGKGSVKLNWWGWGAWVFEIWRDRKRTNGTWVGDPSNVPRYRVSWNHIHYGSSGATVKRGCRCVPKEINETLDCTKTWRYRIRGWGPGGWSDFTSKVVNVLC